MQTIPEEIVERTWKKMATMPLEEVPLLIDRMQKEQPEILAFLMVIDSDILNQDERELQLYLGTVIWQIMRQGTPPPKRVSEEQMTEFIERTEKMAEYLMGDSETEFENSVVQIFKDHNQINVLRYGIEALYEENEEDFDYTNVREEMKGLVFMNLKTVIEALDQ
jgi:hypothetical protein